MEFRTELFQRRFSILNADPKWSALNNDTFQTALKRLHMIEQDKYARSNWDALWEQMRHYFFGNVTPEGWN
jgi:hypothetical protein